MRGSETVMDITDTTAETSDVLDGEVFYAANGMRSVGTLTVPPEMSVLSYGHSTWDDFIAAYSTNSVVYYRASSNSNPASGTQTRMAFMACVNNGDNPTNVEFQYYRSVASHNASQQGDQVFIYKLDKSAGWTVTVREACIKIAAGTGMSQSFASNTLTLHRTSELPSVSASDNGMVLGVVNGAWAKTSSSAWNDISGNFVFYGADSTEITPEEVHALSDGTLVYLTATAAAGIVSIATGEEFAPAATAIGYGFDGSSCDAVVTNSNWEITTASGSPMTHITITYPIA